MRNPPWRVRIGCLLLSALPVLGQALRVSSVSGAPGEKIAVVVSLDPAGQSPATLKWRTIFPAQLLEPDGSGPEAGGAAKESGKSLTCAPREAYSYVCVLVRVDRSRLVKGRS